METSSPVSAAASRSRIIEAIARHAGERGGSVAVAEVGEDGEVGRECTYAELAERAGVLADALCERTGVGDVVIAVGPSGIESVVRACAAIVAGVRLLPMHAQVAGVEAAGVARRAGARVAMAAPGVAAANALGGIAWEQDAAGTERKGGRGLGVLRSRAGAIVLGSSGTTGLPKLALRESGALDADAANVIGGMGLTREDCVLVCTPLSHSYGVDLLLGTLVAGATMHVVARFDAGVLARQMHKRATVLPGVPFVFEAMAREGGEARSRSSRLRLALSAGSSLPERVRREFTGAWGLEVGQLYGATELGTVSMEIPGTEGFDPASVGRALPGVSMRVVDCDDPARRMGAGEEGELAVRAPSMLSGYLDGEVPMADGHLLTGDLARIDERGRVSITGRKKLLIDVGAYKVNPLEVEQELASHPGVAECVVVGVALSDTIRRLRAVCVAREGARAPTAEELRAFLRGRLSANKVPRVIEFASALLKGPTGKVLRDRV